MKNKYHIDFITNEFAKQRKKDFQKSFNKSSLKIGDFIKKKFFDLQGNNEHLWIEIIKIQPNGLLVGIIKNIPLFIEGYQYEQRVKVRLKEIEDIKRV